MPFLDENFLLETDASRQLYQEYAAPQPIFDYHCHLPPRDLARNRQFENLFEIWLEGDHYKWRAMRYNGEPERFCTGDATPYEKFLAWARTVPHTLRNPLYHWTHIELQRYFGIYDTLNEQTAPSIWERANAVLQDGLDAHAILAKFDVRLIGTTDDPAETLEFHEQIAASTLSTRVVPTFRPDAALRVHLPIAWNAWIERLADITGTTVNSLSALLRAIEQRMDDFHNLGCRASDHGLDHCYAESCTESQAAAIFDAARSGHAADTQEHLRFASFLMHFLGGQYAKRQWTMQLHLGALRNPNTRALKLHGPDTGFDAMGATPQLHALATFLDNLEREGALPRTIVYNSNPIENYAFATLIGSFSACNIPGKVQFGSGWWFLDQKEGMEWQMNALSNAGLLSRFVGMVTDSRSFMSYPRHEYFRRTLCNLLGNDIERGFLPNNLSLVGSMVSDICYANAERYFQIPALNAIPDPVEQ